MRREDLEPDRPVQASIADDVKTGDGRNGAHALWIEKDGIRVESVNGARGERPWVVRPRARGKGNEKPREAFPEPDPISDEDG